MAMAGNFEAMKAILLVGLALVSCVANGASSRGHGVFTNRRGLEEAIPKVFDITAYGAKADDDTNDNTQSVMDAWVAARDFSGPATLLIPKGAFLTGPVVMAGPLAGKDSITVEIQGTLKATTDISDYSSAGWISFENLPGLTLVGDGTFDGQGESAWKYNDCKSNSKCVLGPDSLKFMRVNNSKIEGITSLNSKGFHMHIVGCTNVTIQNIKVTAPGNSPNTDGMHISSSSKVNVSSSVIGTGDDCVSVGQGVIDLSVTGVVCGPGHGISVGSLGKYPNEKDVSGITVTNCTFKNTTNGARIKTWAGSGPSLATGIHFRDLILDGVKNPVIIDQSYGGNKAVPSGVKVTDVQFSNIKGTTVSEIPVSLQCSASKPCEGVELVDIDLAYTGPKQGIAVTSACANAKFTTSGTLNPVPCP